MSAELFNMPKAPEVKFQKTVTRSGQRFSKWPKTWSQKNIIASFTVGN